MNKEDAIALLDKKIGPNSEIIGYDKFINTSYEPLNKVISGKYDGGLPYGRIVEIVGESSSGKCITADTMLLTEHGMMTIAELFGQEGYEAVCVSKTLPHKAGLVNENNEIENTSHFHWNNRTKTIKFVTNSGREIKSTHYHPLRVLTRRGNVVWRKAKDIEVGDYLLTMIGTNRFGDGSLNADEAKLLGYLIADGCCAYECHISFSNTDEEVIAEFKRIASSLTTKEIVEKVKKTDTSCTKDYVINSKEFRTTLKLNYGLDYALSKDKQVPLSVRCASKEAQIAFLRGYLELECHIASEYRQIEVTSASKLLLSQVQLMLLNLGVASSLNEKKVKGYEENQYWRLIITGDSFDNYIKTVGFETSARLAKVREAQGFERTVERTYRNCVPFVQEDILDLFRSFADTSREDNLLMTNFRDPSRSTQKSTIKFILDRYADRRNEQNSVLFDKLQALVNPNIIFEEVVEKSDNGEVPTFDVALPETHSFWSNGFISHNTLMATKMMIETQALGGVAIFIDWERAFSIDLARNLGLNTERPYFFYFTPETWEDGNKIAIQVCETLRDNAIIDADAPIMAVFDSIASAVPASSAAKDIDAYNMNDTTALARVASTTLKVMAQKAWKTNATFVYLNQVRTVPGAYVPTTSTPGGKAMEYFSSVRLFLNKKKIVDKDKKYLGQKITIEARKNKITKPFGVCSVDMYYNAENVPQFDYVSSLIDLLVENKKLEVSGAYIQYGEKKYFKSQLVKKITDECAYDELSNLLKA